MRDITGARESASGRWRRVGGRPDRRGADRPPAAMPAIASSALGAVGGFQRALLRRAAEVSMTRPGRVYFGVSDVLTAYRYSA